jgi:hypothetical protein
MSNIEMVLSGAVGHPVSGACFFCADALGF